MPLVVLPETSATFTRLPRFPFLYFPKRPARRIGHSIPRDQPRPEAATDVLAYDRRMDPIRVIYHALHLGTLATANPWLSE